jgi:hypothetical protein
VSRAPLRTLPSPRARDLSRATAAVSEAAADPTLPMAITDFWDLRRLGLFDDDGRVPPSWLDR